ncbi:MAG: ribose-5-phosphate isomerase A [Gemmatales bacterium]|nr:MAG: ribose-5-phosphate isomerase A [Gemmatales bacterium]
MQKGMHIRGVPTSSQSADLARRLGIPLVSLDDVDAIDIDVDGADEVDPQGQLIKGLGGALVWEKIVAAASTRLLILVGEEKLVHRLGDHGILPVEVVPFALAFCKRRFAAMGFPAEVRRTEEGNVFITDNHNYILDCQVGENGKSRIADPEQLERELQSIPGVVGTGLFLGMADTILIGKADGTVETWKRS